MKQAILVLITLMTTLSLFAQRDETILSRTNLRITGAWGGPELTLMNIESENVIGSGGYGGLEFNKEFFVGWGGATLNIPNKNGISRGLDYNGAVLSYMPNAHQVVHPKATLLIGGGSARTNANFEQESIFILQPSVGAEVNVLRWVRLSADVGYRYVNGSELPTLTDSNLSGFFGGVSLKFGFSWGKSDRYKYRDDDDEA